MMRRSKALAPECRETLLVISVLISADIFFFLFFLFLFYFIFFFFWGGGGGGLVFIAGKLPSSICHITKNKGFHVNLNDKWKRR